VGRPFYGVEDIVGGFRQSVKLGVLIWLLHIDPLTPSNAIMQGAGPYCGENNEPGRTKWGV